MTTLALIKFETFKIAPSIKMRCLLHSGKNDVDKDYLTKGITIKSTSYHILYKKNTN